MTEHREQKGYILIFAAGILWGTIGIFLKEMSLCGASAIEIAFLRMAFAFLCMLVITALNGGLPSMKIGRKELLYCALLGIVCHGIHNILYSLAVSISGVSVSAVVMNIAPAVTLLTALFLFSEKLTSWKAFAICLNIAGCTLAVTGGDFSFGNVSVIGILCSVGAGATYGLVPIIGRFAMKNVNVFVSSTYSYLFAALMLVVPAKPWTFQMDMTFMHLILLVVILALVPTSLGYIIYYRGLSMITETSKASVLASNQTVVAAVLGMLIYHETLNLISWIGIITVLVSISCMNMNGTRKTRRSGRMMIARQDSI